jgi:hypothetical protein
MKKVLMIGLAAGAALSSCKKDHTCSCTNVATIGTSTFVIQKSKKADARTACEQAETTYKVTSESATCDLK